MEGPSCKANATEPQSEQDEVEARPKDALRDHGRSDDGCNNATDAIATMCRTQDSTRGLNVRAEHIIQSQASCCTITYKKEAVGMLVLDYCKT